MAELNETDYRPTYEYKEEREPSANSVTLRILFVATIVILFLFGVAYIVSNHNKASDEVKQVYTQPKESSEVLFYDEGIVTQVLAEGQYITIITIKDHEYVIYNNDHALAPAITHSASCKNENH